MARKDDLRAIKAFAGVWVFVLALNLAWWAFVVWVIIQLLQHFAVI